MTLEMKFKGKKKPIGTSYFVLIPKPVADFLDISKEYIFTIKEVKQIENAY